MATLPDFISRVITENFVFAAAATKSAAVRTNFAAARGFYIPANWTNAQLTFEASVDGVNFYEMRNANNIPLSITLTEASKVYALSANDLSTILYLKLVSGIAQVNAVTVPVTFLSL
jgi:hypothetical protein